MSKNFKLMSKKVLIVLLTLAVIIGFGMPGISYTLAATGNTSVASYASSSVAQPKIPAKLKGKTVRIVSYKTGSNYVATKATSDDTINSPSASSNIVSVTLCDVKNTKKTYTVKASKGVMTLVVKGAQYDIIRAKNNKTKFKSGTYSFAATSGADTYTEPAKFGNMGGNTSQYTYRSALKIKDGAIDAAETIKSLLKKATYSKSTIKNGSLTSKGGFFNGIIVDAASKNTTFNIDKMKMYFNGDGANDFQGEGAAILAQTSGKDTKATSTVNINQTYVHTKGVIRTAAAAKGNGILNIKNSVIYAEETGDTNAQYNALVVPMMKRTPFALGLEGTVRATNILGSAQGIYKDSMIVSSGWGALSTDSGTSYANNNNQYALNVSGVTAGIGSVEKAKKGKTYTATKTVNGTKYGFTMKGSGYVAYADSGVHDKFTNVKFYSPDYAQIMASSTSSAYYTNSTIKSGRIAVMTQQNAGGTISIKDSTVSAADTAVQIKSGAANAGYTNVVLDNAKVKLGTSHKWGGTLVELVESDDAGNPGVTSYKTSDTGDSATYGKAAIKASNASIKNGTYTGNIWNNIYNKTESLNVNIDNAKLTGTISSSYGYHLTAAGKRMANGTTLNACTTGDYRKGTLTDYKKIGAQYNVANEQVNNPVNVKLSNNSTWKIDLADGTNGQAKACYINNLSVEAGSTLTSDYPVTVYVYGTQDIKGTVGSNVTIKSAAVDKTGSTDDGVATTTQFYDQTPVTFKAVDENGDNCAVSAIVEYKAFTTLQFNVEPTDGYTITDVKADKGSLNKTTGDYAYELTNASGNKDTVTVTITVKKS